MLGFDDALDAFGVHGVGGIWGGILTGILANPDVSEGNAGAAYGNPKQIGIQLAGIVFTMAFSFIMTLVILIPLDQIFKAITKVGVRVTEEVEDTGLDISEHGESMVSQHEHKFDAGKVEPMITTVQNDGA